MAKVLSGNEVVKRLADIGRMIDALILYRRKIESLAERMEDEGQLATTVATMANAMLTEWGDDRDEIVSRLQDLPLVYQSKVKVGMPARYAHAVVYATNESNIYTNSEACALIRVGGSEWAENEIFPFSVFQADDIVSVSGANGNKITGARVGYTPETTGGEKMVYTSGSWTAGTNWTAAGSTYSTLTLTGAAVSTGTAVKLPKASMNGGAWLSAHHYLVSFTLSGVSGGSVSVGTNTNTFYTATANTRHHALISADAHADGLVFKSADTTAFTGVISKIECIPFTGLALDAPLNADNDSDTTLVVTLQER